MITRSIPLLLLIAAAAGISYRYHLLLLAQRDQVEHTYRVITALESTLVRIIDAETGQRGYVITGDDAYLAPYASAVREVPVTLAQLRALIADSPAQLQRERALGARVDDKLAELRQTIEARHASGFKAARALVMRDSGRVEMDAVRDLIAAMRNAEGELLVRRSAEARATEGRLLAVTLGCMLLSLVARIGLALVRTRAPPAVR